MKRITSHIAVLLGFFFIHFSVYQANAQDATAFPDGQWFVGAGLGLNVGLNTHEYVSVDDSNFGMGLALDVYGGYTFHNKVTLSAGIKGWSISDCLCHFGQTDYFYVHSDVFYRLYKWLVPYAHMGYIYLNKGTPAVGVGLMFPVRISRRVSFIPDFNFSALKGVAIYDASRRTYFTPSVTFGVSVSLGSPKPRRTNPNLWRSVENVGGNAWRKVEEAPVVAPKTQKNGNPPVPQTEKPAVNNSAASRVVLDYMPPLSGGVSQQGVVGVGERKEVREYIDDPYARSETSANETVEEVEAVEEQEAAADAAPQLVYFDSGSSRLDAKSTGMLDALAEKMLADPDLTLLVVGHSDSQGSAQNNFRLSTERAFAVKIYLIGKGINGGRIQTRSLGADEPAASNDTASGRRENRRAAIYLFQ